MKGRNSLQAIVHKKLRKEKGYSMWQLIKFEIQKLMGKKLTLACLLGMALMEAVMIANYIYPGGEAVQYFQEGELVTLDGSEAIREAQAIAEKYEGPLTDEKVQAILADFDMAEEDMKKHGLDPSMEGMYTHNFLYASLKAFYNGEGVWNGLTVQEVYGDLTKDLRVGYSSGWISLLIALLNTLISLGCVLIIILAPLFAEEYTRGTDALILTAAYGKNKCARAKIIAGFLITLGLVGVVILSFAGAYLLFYGTEGLEASVQISDTGAFRGVSYPMNCGQAVLFALLMWLTASLVLAAVSILVSAAAKSAFNSLVISFVLFVLPLFVNWESLGALNLPAQFLPIRQMRLFEIYACPLLHAGPLEVNLMWLSVPLTLAAVILGSLYAGRAFARHQVV